MVVKAGSTETFTVTAKITSTSYGNTYGVEIVNLETSTSVEGLPLSGSEFEIVNMTASAGGLTFTNDNATSDVKIGEESKLAGFKLKVTNDNEDVTLKSIRFKQVGSIDEQYIT
jgi:hypothetical protein